MIRALKFKGSEKSFCISETHSKKDFLKKIKKAAIERKDSLLSSSSSSERLKGNRTEFNRRASEMKDPEMKSYVKDFGKKVLFDKLLGREEI